MVCYKQIREETMSEKIDKAREAVKLASAAAKAYAAHAEKILAAGMETASSEDYIEAERLDRIATEAGNVARHLLRELNPSGPLES